MDMPEKQHTDERAEITDLEISVLFCVCGGKPFLSIQMIGV